MTTRRLDKTSIARLFGGELSVASRVAFGRGFTLRLPRAGLSESSDGCATLSSACSALLLLLLLQARPSRALIE